MKKINIFLSGILVLLSACQTEKISPAHASEDEPILVSLALTGEVTIDEQPLVITRSGETSSTDLYGVQVKYYDNNNYKHVPYAYGLFDNVSDMKIYLHSGTYYIIECSLIKNGKNIIAKVDEMTFNRNYYNSYDYTATRNDPQWRSGSGIYDYDINNSDYLSQNNTMGSGYTYPFVTFQKKSTLSSGISEWSPKATPVTNEFIYSSSEDEKFYRLSSGSVVIKGSDMGLPVFDYPEVDRYYGENGYTAKKGDNNTISVMMRHVVFGLRYKITGITDGRVHITVKNDSKTFIDEAGITSDKTGSNHQFCFTDILSAWQYADGYAENVTVSMTWTRSVGVAQDLGSQIVQVKRNCLNTINISLGAEDGGAQLGVSPENTEMGNLSYDLSY